ncbi:MAG: DUF1016 family protein [Arcobacteraceae bacterium]|nr:DUF1016 family protein [Arcobacteraceae bacterium]
MSEEKISITNSFVSDIKEIIDSSRDKAVRSVEFYRVQMYWELGERIFNEEQCGKKRADYGSFLIKNLAKELEPQFGSGFSQRQLERSRKFYREFPIASALRSQFNWFQYRTLISISDKDKREYYELETVKNRWNGRELERQINSQLYERLLISNDKNSVMAVAREEKIPTTATEIIKDPMYLEFLGLEQKPHYYEKELESALLEHIQEFLLELGNGFTFVARQKRLLLEDDEFFADLVFYNRLLKCFVIVELKTDKITHQDLGQLQMYVNYYDRYEKSEDEKPTIGILLTPNKNHTIVELTLPKESNVYASEYQLYLPKKELFENEVEKWVTEFEESKRLTKDEI